MLRAFIEAWSVPELRQKILFTLVMLAVYRLGAAIPTPGVDINALQAATSGVSGILNVLSLVGGANLEQFSIFALGVLPYITASIIMQVLTTAVPALEKLSKEGEEGRKTINQYTRLGAIGLGTIQALFSFAFLNDNVIKIGWGENVLLFRAVVVLTLVAGIALAMWIGERITEYGIGNGMSLIIFAGIVTQLPIQISQTAQLINTGAITLVAVLLFLALIVAEIAAIVFVQQGERRVPVQYARKVVGKRQYGGQATYIPMKINAAGVIPIIFASAILQLPQLLLQNFQNQPWAQNLINILSITTWSGLLIEVVFIFAFTYFFTTISFDPKRIAESLREYGGFIPGVRPGQPTQDYLANISTRITLWGALFLGILAVLPYIFQNITGVNSFNQLTGTTLLIVVGVALDTLKQLESQLTLRNYEGFINRGGRLRDRGGEEE
jgi:preprotein translocase subunit SecY